GAAGASLHGGRGTAKGDLALGISRQAGAQPRRTGRGYRTSEQRARAPARSAGLGGARRAGTRSPLPVGHGMDGVEGVASRGGLGKPVSRVDGRDVAAPYRGPAGDPLRALGQRLLQGPNRRIPSVAGADI